MNDHQKDSSFLGGLLQGYSLRLWQSFGMAALCRDSISYSNAKKQKLQVRRGKIGFIMRKKSV